jgi:superfamily II RNA helicase
MVVICDKPCLNADGTPYQAEYDGKQLSEFQKWAIKAIREGRHVLITAHTGSGKTLPAEFAIQYFTSPERQKKKKVIYASPIKALSNQKLYDFKRKFPDILFGIMTGDCKDNPDADVVIMTTEILRGRGFTPYKPHQTLATDSAVPQIPDVNQSSSFSMDFKDVAAVIFDEVHYINDPERGAVWEQAILLLPPHVQLIMLSATIDRPEEFAGWIESEKQKQMEKQLPTCLGGAWGGTPQVYLASTTTRHVPLTHYMWLSMPSKTYKYAKHNPIEAKLPDLHNKPILIADSNGLYHERNYYKVKEAADFMRQNDINVKRHYVLDELLHYLKKEEMLPAICFIFSRKNVEKAAKEISFSLFEANSPLPGLVEAECRHILSKKFLNYLEYMDLPEYKEIVSLLQKGIAIHHAGILPVLREMVELLFEKGFIKLLIATETFAVGLNMPTKTVIFLGLSKYNGSTMRLLFPHEYTQMAGRAGRRGIDTIGHVIHCVNLFEMPLCSEYKHLLTGPPQTLTSKFKISFQMTLSMLGTGQDILAFMEQSLLSSDIRKELRGYVLEESHALEQIEKKKGFLALCRTPLQVLSKYKTLQETIQGLANSARKKARIELNGLEAEHKFIANDLLKLQAIDETELAFKRLQKNKDDTRSYIKNTIAIMEKMLIRHGFLELGETPPAKQAPSPPLEQANLPLEEGAGLGTSPVTPKGLIATVLQEVHSLAMADLYCISQGFSNLSSAHLAGLFSCFYPISVSDEVKVNYYSSGDLELISVIEYLYITMNKYRQEEVDAFLDSGSSYELQYDLINYVVRWCIAENDLECKLIIKELKEGTGVFLGEFIKALLKVNAVALEFEKVCEMEHNMLLLEKLRAIPKQTLKYIATNQSLYL